MIQEEIHTKFYWGQSDTYVKNKITTQKNFGLIFTNIIY